MAKKSSGDQAMAITERRPMTLLERLEHDLEEIRRQMSGLRRPMVGQPFPTALLEIDWLPTTDAYEEDGTFIIKADLPGVKKEDVAVAVEGGVLTISGKRQEEREREDAHYYMAERFTGTFSRSFPLPERVDADKIQAQFGNGILEVRVPLPPGHKTPKTTIPIKD